jgi:predicted O-linked N-acetylglucosamine transferase (SPINDLY family)
MNSSALLEQAERLQRAGNMPDAARAYSQVLRQEPANAQALQQLGLICFTVGQYTDAERLLASAVRVNPGSAELSYSRGCALQQLGRHEDALAAFARALSIRPDFVEARNNRGVTLLTLERAAEALACFDRIVKQYPQLATVHNNRATALNMLKRHEEALHAADTALALQPDSADALFGRGSALAGLGRREDALASFDRALAASPNHVNALTYRGIVLEMLQRPGEALDSYNAALRARPNDPNLLFNRTSALAALGRYAEVVPDCDRVLAVHPHFKFAQGNRLFAKIQCCDWENLNTELAAAVEDQRAGYPVFQPLQAATFLTGENDLLDCARIWVANEFPASAAPIYTGQKYRHDKIRVAYVSSDFGFHPVMLLALGAFEQHDRSRFEVTAISTGSDDGSATRRRLLNGFDRFIDVRNRGAREVAELMRNLEIDIAVDLMGHTQNAPTAVFANRPAPIQVNFLGFPGTSAAPYMDYIIADRIVITQQRGDSFSEKIAWLPNSCLPNDNTRPIGAPVSRGDAGLPEHGFVFCNFGKTHKITSDIFAAWMRVLSQTPDSVLWLASMSDIARENLRREADKHGVHEGRLHFAQFVDSPEHHLARIGLADLFLDTFPYNAHATACDFLWAGVPVLTLTGGGFAGRVGASLLAAAGLGALITESVDAYEQVALQTARDAAALRALKDDLARERDQSALFDTVRFTRNLERAFTEMWQRHQSGASPTNFSVEEDHD